MPYASKAGKRSQSQKRSEQLAARRSAKLHAAKLAAAQAKLADLQAAQRRPRKPSKATTPATDGGKVNPNKRRPLTTPKPDKPLQVQIRQPEADNLPAEYRDAEGLTVPERLFVTAYAGDAYAAAKVSGHTVSEAAHLMRQPRIRAAIRNAQAPRLQAAALTADRVLLELSRLAFLDPRRLAWPDGTLKALDELDEDTAAALAGFTIGNARRPAPATPPTGSESAAGQRSTPAGSTVPPPSLQTSSLSGSSERTSGVPVSGSGEGGGGVVGGGVSPISQNFEGDFGNPARLEKVKFVDKLGALKLAMQYMQMLTEKHELNVSKSEPLIFTANM